MIVDEEEWDENVSKPSGKLVWRDDGTGGSPIQVNPLPLNNAFFSLVQTGKSDLEYIGGIPSPTMGIPVREQQETFRGLVAQDEFATRRLKQWIETVFEPWMNLVGETVFRFCQLYYDVEKTFAITVPNEAGEPTDKQTRINVPIYSTMGEIIGRINDIRFVKYNVKFVSGSTRPSNRAAREEMYWKYYQGGLIDDRMMLMETNVKNKEALLKRKSLYAQLNGQLQQAGERIKDLEGTIETLERQLVQAGIRVKINEADKQIYKETVETKEKIRSGQRDALNKMAEEVKRSKQQVDMFLEMQKREAQIRGQISKQQNVTTGGENA
jgi:hypothetical protein